MKRTAKIGSILLVAIAAQCVCAADKPPVPTPKPQRLVRIFFNPAGASGANATWRTGDTVPAKQLIEILFIGEPCPLDIVDQDNMLRAWRAYGSYQLGCWYPTIDGKYAFVGQLPPVTQAGGTYWEALPRAVLNEDGSATIWEQNYNSNTFPAEVMQRKTSEISKHLNERP